MASVVITSPDYHIEQIRKLNDESKRISARLKQLREEKKKHERHVFGYMTRMGLQEYKGIKKARIEPKVKAKRTTKKVKEARAYELCLRTGIPDPRAFIEQYKASQKPDPL